MGDGSSVERLLGKPISRRDFLKGAGVVMGGVLSLSATGCGETSANKENVSFRKIETGDSLLLPISGKENGRVFFQYANKDINELSVRSKQGFDSLPLPFIKDAGTVRLLGEICENKLYKVTGYNSSLGVGQVGVYPTFLGEKSGSSGREELSDLGEVYAINVIVSGEATKGYLLENPPLEINVNPNTEEKVPTFGNGLMVGKLNQNERDYIFVPLGYICDARAVNSA